MFSYIGASPVRRYIPRKPHPNGLLGYALASFTIVGTNRLPVLFDFEPYVVGNTPTAQEAMMRLHRRYREVYIPSLPYPCALMPSPSPMSDLTSLSTLLLALLPKSES